MISARHLGFLLIGGAGLSLLYVWGVPKTIEPHFALGEELCGAVYQVRDGASVHVRPSFLSRRTEVTGARFYVTSCMQQGPWHGVRKVESDCLSDDADAACTIGWVHENNLELVAG
jgi:hypothetical protein